MLLLLLRLRFRRLWLSSLWSVWDEIVSANVSVICASDVPSAAVVVVVSPSPAVCGCLFCFRRPSARVVPLVPGGMPSGGRMVPTPRAAAPALAVVASSSPVSLVRFRRPPAHVVPFVLGGMRRGGGMVPASRAAAPAPAVVVAPPPPPCLVCRCLPRCDLDVASLCSVPHLPPGVRCSGLSFLGELLRRRFLRSFGGVFPARRWRWRGRLWSRSAVSSSPLKGSSSPSKAASAAAFVAALAKPLACCWAGSKRRNRFSATAPRVPRQL